MKECEGVKLLRAEKHVDMRMGISYRIVHSKTERLTEHTHDYAEMFVMLTGVVRHTVGDVSWRLHAGDIVFVRPTDVHRFSIFRDNEFSFINITFTVDTLKEVFSFLGGGFPSDALMGADLPPVASLSRHALSRLDGRIKALGAISPDDTANLKTALRILIMKLFTDHFYSYVEATESVPTWLEQTVAQMRSEGNFALGTARMLELSGKTREHLARSMKKYYGQTVSEFVNELRLNYIANMLRNSRRKITDVVLDSGFNSVSRAASLFRAKFGVTMREFRK